MKLIETKTLGTAAASIEFTSIPQTFTDLVVKISSRSDRAGSHVAGIRIDFNGLSTNFSTRSLFGDGSTATSNTDIEGRAGLTTATSSTSNTFGNTELYIVNYAGATNKSVSVDSVTETNDSPGFQWLAATLWSNTSAITTVGLSPANSSNFIAGSTISLYGITKGSDGIVTTS
jgi:hypothetical protein